MVLADVDCELESAIALKCRRSLDLSGARSSRPAHYRLPMDTALLAHQGGWDEIVLVAGPLVILWGLLVLANRRAKCLNKQKTEAG